MGGRAGGRAGAEGWGPRAPAETRSKNVIGFSLGGWLVRQPGRRLVGMKPAMPVLTSATPPAAFNPFSPPINSSCPSNSPIITPVYHKHY